MNRSVLRLTILGLTVAVAAGCADQAQQPSEPSSIPSAAPATPSMLAYAIPSCPSTQDSAQKSIDQLLPQLFAPGNARRGKAQGLSNHMEKARKDGAAATADTYSDSLINFALQQYYSGQLLNQGSDLAGTQQRLVSFITYIYCFNGVLAAARLRPAPQRPELGPDPQQHADHRRHHVSENAGVKVEQGDVPTTVFGTYVSIIKTTSPLPTSLDWYGIDGYKAGAFEFIADPAVVFTEGVLTGVCISYDDAIVTSVADLRLAHTAPTDPAAITGTVVTTAGGSIEIGAPVSTSPLGLNCTPLPVASRSAFGRALQHFASVFLPEYLAATTKGGSVGSTPKTFSPFAVVDTKLNATGSGPASPQYIPVGNTSISASASVAVKTRHDNTPITGIKVAFKPFASFAPDSVPTAGATGTASSTWTLVEGTNNATAEPAVPLGFTSAVTFSVNAIQENDARLRRARDGPQRATGYAVSEPDVHGQRRQWSRLLLVGSNRWSPAGRPYPELLDRCPQRYSHRDRVVQLHSQGQQRHPDPVQVVLDGRGTPAGHDHDNLAAPVGHARRLLLKELGGERRRRDLRLGPRDRQQPAGRPRSLGRRCHQRHTLGARHLQLQRDRNERHRCHGREQHEDVLALGHQSHVHQSDVQRGAIEEPLLRRQCAHDAGNRGKGHGPERQPAHGRARDHGGGHEQRCQGGRQSVLGRLQWRVRQLRRADDQQDRRLCPDHLDRHTVAAFYEHIGEVHDLAVLLMT